MITLFGQLNRKVLTLEMEHYLQRLFQEIAEDKGFLVSMVEVDE